MDTTNKRALKAGVWYVCCNIITNGIYFLTTPIFTRLLSQEDFGITATYSSYVAIFTVIATLDLYSCIQFSKVEFDNKSKEFLSSILFLSSISVIFFYLLFKILSFFMIFQTNIPNKLIEVLFLEIIFKNAFTMLQTQHRAYLKYKEFVAMTIVSTVLGQSLAIIFVSVMSNEQYTGRIMGTAIPFFIIGIVIIITVFYRGRTFYNREYWKFGLKISLPLVPHHLSGNILSQFDRIIINSCVGAEYAALYSLSSNYSLVVQVVWNSLNNAWIPWFYEKMKQDSIDEIKKFCKVYTIFFTVITLGMIAIAPEAVLVLGGETYKESISAIPPIILGVFFQFLYSLYINVEFYHKKTKIVAIGTMIAAVTNIILNYVFIPKFGYVAAAYTTLAGYVLLFVLHYFIAKKIEKRDLFDKKFLVFITAGCIFLTVIIANLYKKVIYRYASISILCVTAVVCVIKERKTIQNFFSKEASDARENSKKA